MEALVAAPVAAHANPNARNHVAIHAKVTNYLFANLNRAARHTMSLANPNVLQIAANHVANLANRVMIHAIHVIHAANLSMLNLR